MSEKEVSLDSIMPRDCQPKAKRIVGVVNEQRQHLGCCLYRLYILGSRSIHSSIRSTGLKAIDSIEQLWFV